MAASPSPEEGGAAAKKVAPVMIVIGAHHLCDIAAPCARNPERAHVCVLRHGGLWEDHVLTADQLPPPCEAEGVLHRQPGPCCARRAQNTPPASCAPVGPPSHARAQLPFEPNIDIRDTVNYKEVMAQYGLGPNGGIVTSLNLFATKFEQVLSIVEARASEKDYILLDTPGQIEVFTYSASGQIIMESLASALPCVIVYVVDTPRSTSPTTFMSNMLYACSILYRSKLPFVLAFNKTDIVDHAECIEWMTDYGALRSALEGDGSFMSTLCRSMGIVLEEFYANLRAVGVSAHTVRAAAPCRSLWTLAFGPTARRRGPAWTTFLPRWTPRWKSTTQSPCGRARATPAACAHAECRYRPLLQQLHADREKLKAAKAAAEMARVRTDLAGGDDVVASAGGRDDAEALARLEKAGLDGDLPEGKCQAAPGRSEAAAHVCHQARTQTWRRRCTAAFWRRSSLVRLGPAAAARDSRL